MSNNRPPLPLGNMEGRDSVHMSAAEEAELQQLYERARVLEGKKMQSSMMSEQQPLPAFDSKAFAMSPTKSDGGARSDTRDRSKNTRIARNEAPCGGCGRYDHQLSRCPYPNEDGYVVGCGRCNTTDHSFDDCKINQKKPFEEYHYKRAMRTNKPPAESRQDWRLITNPRTNEISNLEHLPYSLSTSKSQAAKDAWSNWVCKGRNVIEDFGEDPHWERGPDNIPINWNVGDEGQPRARRDNRKVEAWNLAKDNKLRKSRGEEVQPLEKGHRANTQRERRASSFQPRRGNEAPAPAPLGTSAGYSLGDLGNLLETILPYVARSSLPMPRIAEKEEDLERASDTAVFRFPHQRYFGDNSAAAGTNGRNQTTQERVEEYLAESNKASERRGFPPDANHGEYLEHVYGEMEQLGDRRSLAGPEFKASPPASVIYMPPYASVNDRQGRGYEEYARQNVEMPFDRKRMVPATQQQEENNGRDRMDVGERTGRASQQQRSINDRVRVRGHRPGCHGRGHAPKSCRFQLRPERRRE